MLRGGALNGRASAVLLAAASLTAAAPAPAASAPVLRTDRGCYTHNQGLSISGAGFAPGVRQSIFLDGRLLGALTANADGAIAGRPILAPAAGRSATATRRYTLTAAPSGAPSATAARTSFDVVHTTIGSARRSSRRAW